MAQQTRFGGKSINRRTTLAAAAGVAGGAGVMATLGSDTAEAAIDAEAGPLEVQGADRTVGGQPQAVTVSVAGSFDVAATETMEQVRVTLQIEVNGTSDDLATDAVFDTNSGTFDLSANLLDHRDVRSGDLTPSENGASTTTEVVARVIIAAINNDELKAEKVLQDSADLRLTRQGIEIVAEATGNVTVTE